jgi:hypothetical protein
MRGEKGKKRERREILVGEGKEADELGRNRKGFLPPSLPARARDGGESGGKSAVGDEGEMDGKLRWEMAWPRGFEWTGAPARGFAPVGRRMEGKGLAGDDEGVLAHTSKCSYYEKYILNVFKKI